MIAENMSNLSSIKTKHQNVCFFIKILVCIVKLYVIFSSFNYHEKLLRLAKLPHSYSLFTIKNTIFVKYA